MAHSWFSTTEDFASDVEIRLFSLSLIYYAYCAGAEDGLADLMSKSIELSQDFNGTQAIRSHRDKAALTSVKDWLEQAITYSKGFLKPVQAVLAEVSNECEPDD